MGKEKIDVLVFNPDDFVQLKEQLKEYYKNQLKASLGNKEQIVNAINEREIIARNGEKCNNLQLDEFEQFFTELHTPPDKPTFTFWDYERRNGKLITGKFTKDECEKIEPSWLIIYESCLMSLVTAHAQNINSPKSLAFAYEPYLFSDDPKAAADDIKAFEIELCEIAKPIIEEHQKEIKEIKDKFEFALNEFENKLLEKPDDRKELKEKGQNVLDQIKSLSKQVQNEYDHENIKKLTEILDTCNEVLLTPSKNKQEMITLATKLAQTSQEVSGKASPFWKDIAKGLLLFACAALVVACVLAAIPTGGSSLLIAAIGVAGIGVAAGLTSSVALHKSKETGLAKSITEYKQTLFKEIRQEKKSHDNPEQPSPALPNR